MMPWIAEFIKLLATELPVVLARHGQGNEVAALQEFLATYQKRRTGTIPDRDDEIAANRAAVDAKLNDRENGE